jgi:exportin-T
MSTQTGNNFSNNNIFNIDLSYLENCVSQLYNPNPNNQVKEYVEKVKNYYSINLNLIPNLFEFFTKSTIPQFQFWDLDLLINLTNNFYPHIPNETKQLIRQLIISLIQNELVKLYKIPYISSKFCLFIITWLKYDYPQNFSSFFNDLIKQIINVKDNDLRMKYIIFFIDLLLIFDDELIKFRHTYTEFESKKSTEIKDFIRLNCINDIISLINELLSNEQYIDDKIIN